MVRYGTVHRYNTIYKLSLSFLINFFVQVSGLAKLEGEIADIDEGEDEAQPTRYQLTGIVVHSGQASGGHYYSYILHK